MTEGGRVHLKRIRLIVYVKVVCWYYNYDIAKLRFENEYRFCMHSQRIALASCI